MRAETVGGSQAVPTLRFMLSHPAHCLSLGFGAGLIPFAPGTWGALLGLVLARWGQPVVGDLAFMACLAVAFVLGVWATRITERALGEHDHPAIVWDEIVAMAFVAAIVNGSLAAQAVLFLLFRLFDIVKPGPVGWADRRFDGGWGVMFDDAVAAGLTLFLAAVVVRLW
ncbi:MAG: phosphatidylglycerophosphatase A [Casimicrobiaceae bacterium]|nr:phosphatidylglycerophosphatase A [Casimicrobiaceae bacterium]MCX8099172.1 phosphatidylglycerophosphatase A [Casimicrobiaceae bacterium]MDW8312611.1 phosphatidylglycerophosphatase A [Burkholderiales bacterium]